MNKRTRTVYLSLCLGAVLISDCDVKYYMAFPLQWYWGSSRMENKGNDFVKVVQDSTAGFLYLYRFYVRFSRQQAAKH